MCYIDLNFNVQKAKRWRRVYISSLANILMSGCARYSYNSCKKVEFCRRINGCVYIEIVEPYKLPYKNEYKEIKKPNCDVSVLEGVIVCA